MKRWLISLFLSFLFCLAAKPILAGEEFSTSYQVTYQANENRWTHVHQEITLTNNLAYVYAQQYSLIINSLQVQNVTAFYNQQPLLAETSQEGEQTIIRLTFEEKVVGKGKSLSFVIDYDLPNLIQKNGQVWEVSVPQLADSGQINQYQLTLLAPQSFGQLSFVNPLPQSQITNNGQYQLTFNKEGLINTGVRAVFGTFQTFDFSLDYHLENTKLAPVKTEIALPPDTTFQQVAYESIEPSPVAIRVDADGNWLAEYPLASKEKLNISARGKVKLFSEPRQELPEPTAENLAKNLSPQPFWETEQATIQQKAQSLKTVEKINQFVVQTLDYDFDLAETAPDRQGALAILSQPEQAICMEFTDLFIALARAAGIPAREINGYAYTTNEKLRPLSLVADVLHAWPEYWDEGKGYWVPLDPAWEKTTGGIDHFGRPDLNHFAFVIHGEDSQYPPPAGAYKTNGLNSKDIHVSFSQTPPEAQPELEIEFDLAKNALPGQKIRGQLIVKNTGAVAFHNLGLSLQAGSLELESEETPKITTLPPFTTRTIPIKLQPVNWLDYGTKEISVVANHQTFSHQLQIQSLATDILLAVGLILILLLGWFLLKKPFDKWRQKMLKKAHAA